MRFDFTPGRASMAVHQQGTTTMVVRAGREFLALPGPTTMPDEVLRAMHRPALDIYSDQMVELTDSLLRDLGRLFATTGRCYVYIANGHGAWEATISNVLSRGDKVLVLESGRFAVNWGNAAAAMGADVEVLSGDWRRAVRPAEVEARLRQDKDHTIKAILGVQVDTASGVINDIEAIGNAIKAAVKGPVMIKVRRWISTSPNSVLSMGKNVTHASHEKCAAMATRNPLKMANPFCRLFGS